MADGPMPRFYVYPALLQQAQEISRCFLNQSVVQELSRTQFLFELDVVAALTSTEGPLFSLRAERPSEASVFVLPMVPIVSLQAGVCSGISHDQRIEQMVTMLRTQVNFSAGPHLLTCTCVMQRTAYRGTLFDLLLNHSRSVITLSTARRPPPLSTSYRHVIAPYHSPPSLLSHSSCSGGKHSLAVFAGSTTTGRAQSTAVRQRIANLSLATPSLFEVRPTERRADGSNCGVNGTCVNGFFYGSRHERVPAKPAMAALMHSADFCFVPEGDSPESSRLFDAIAALCTPVVITTSEGLLVPRSSHWSRAALVVSVDEFLAASAADVAAWLTEEKQRHQAQRCEALRRLREDLSAVQVLRRAVLFAAKQPPVPLGEPERPSADADVLLPRLHVLRRADREKEMEVNT